LSAYDVRAREAAHRILRPIAQGGKGQAVGLIKAGHAPYNPATGSGAPLAPEELAACGLELKYSLREIDGTKILATDRMFMLSALGVDGQPITPPVSGMRLVYASGASRRILDVEGFEPAGLAIHFFLQLRA